MDHGHTLLGVDIYLKKGNDDDRSCCYTKHRNMCSLCKRVNSNIEQHRIFAVQLITVAKKTISEKQGLSNKCVAPTYQWNVITSLACW